MARYIARSAAEIQLITTNAARFDEEFGQWLHELQRRSSRSRQLRVRRGVKKLQGEPVR
jgi:hypothetical protein